VPADRLAHEALIHEDFVLALTRYCEILEEFPHDTVSRVLVRRLTNMDAPRRIPVQAAG
jgi:hypothetical protein